TPPITARPLPAPRSTARWRTGAATGKLHYPGPEARRGRPRLGRPLAVAARSVGRHGIDRAARPVAGHGQDRLHVRGEGLLERLEREQRIVGLLVAGELPELDEAGHDHLDVDVGRVMAQVDERERPLAQLARAIIAGAPVVDAGGIEGRLVQLVLDEEPPALRKGAVDVAHAVEVPLEGLSQVHLPGEV